MNQIPFVPWPSEDVIRQGALAQLQVLTEQGIDPSSITARTGDGVKEEEDAMVVDNPGDTATYGRISDNAKLEPRSGLPGQQVERREEKPKVFGGLDLYDPDEEG